MAVKTFSIIIPHKNIPDLLERCLKSIPQRDDLQVIVIDDDSDDPPRHCGEHRHCGLDPQSPANSGDCGIRHNDGRIEFIYAKDPKRRGAGFARNIGLEHAKGKWLIFADADDFFLPDFEKMLDKYADSDADMICFANTAAYSHDTSRAIKQLQFDMAYKIAYARNSIFQKNGISENLDIIRYDTSIVWCRFIKRELVERHKIRFQETICHNDVLFSVKIGCIAKTILLDETTIYCYTVRLDNTVMNRDFEHEKARYFVAKSVMKFLKKQKNATGRDIYNRKYLYYYEQLIASKYLYIKEFISVLFLSTSPLKTRFKIFWQLLKSKIKKIVFPKAERSKNLQVEIHLTEHCNLNCTSCIHFSPLAENEFVDIRQFGKDIKRLAQLTGGQVQTLALSGGEPLLHPNLNELMAISRKYMKRTPITVLTNGILALKQNDDFWETLHKNNIVLTITAYPIKLDVRKIENLAAKHNVILNWYKNEKDFHWAQRAIDLHGKQNIEDGWHCSRFNKCWNLSNGKIYTCPIIPYVRHFNRFFKQNLEVLPEDFMDIHKAKNINQIIDFLKVMPPFCRYCNLKNNRKIEWSVSKKVITEWT